MSDSYYSKPEYFNRGFLYAKEKPIFIPNHYNQINDNLWVSNEIEFAISSNQAVTIFGLVVDVRNDKLTITEIANNLARELNVSEEKFHIEGDFLCGRYAIIYKNNNKIKIVTDATGMRTVYHSKNGDIIASHAKLLADNINKKIVEKKVSIYRGAGTVGRNTPYPNVYLLISNTSLEIGTGDINRFYPRKSFTPMSIDNATNLVEKYVTAAISGVGLRKPLLISITAGIDSRSTLSISTKTKHPITYFTYDIQTPAVKKDVTVATKICKELGLNHQIVQVSPKMDETNWDILTTNTYYSHCKFAYDALKKKLKDQYIHLRSNLLEIGRTFAPFRNVKVVDTEDWLFPFFQKQNGNKKLNNNLIKQYLKEYCKTTNLNKKSIYNYPISDIYYWEQRMSTWQSQVLLVSDLAFDTFIPWNSRCVFETMFSIPYPERIKATILHNIINKNCPKIKDWPINKLT